MGRLLQTIGLFCTLAYIGVICFIFNGRLTQILIMPPNEIGDLLAGVFGPLAILWLILGFFQQGIELRQNTHALKLQAEELKNSVEQQRELVDVSKKQLASHLDSINYERGKERRIAAPVFVFSEVGSSFSSDLNGVLYTSDVENLGSTVRNVRIVSTQDIDVLDPRDFAVFDSKSRYRIQWRSQGKIPGTESWIIVQYIDALGNSGAQIFFATADRKGRFTGKIIAEKIDSGKIE